MLNSTAYGDGDRTPPSAGSSRRLTLALRQQSSPVTSKSTVLSDLILSSTVVEDVMAKLPASVPPRDPKAPDVVAMLLQRSTAALDSTKAEINTLKEKIDDETPLPTVEETRFNTCPQRLTVAINRLIDHFSTNENNLERQEYQMVDIQQPDFVDELLHLSNVTLKKVEIASEIQQH